ncbi:MAG: NAD(P)H-dependent oxidoreductase [Chitinophagaceae bacterium]|nr:NAD(P)H-dependent oxidoreductase [Chitinophagaceae bacterium]
MYTIISGTNREGSNTLKVSKILQQKLKDINIEAPVFSLQEIDMLKRNEKFEQLEAQYLTPTQKFIFVIPEYNGSFPGVFKLMIDMSQIEKSWHHKKVLLFGVSSGRAGNLRGLDVLTNMCNYMKMHVYHQKMPISLINNELIDDEFVNNFTNETIEAILKNFTTY